MRPARSGRRGRQITADVLVRFRGDNEIVPLTLWEDDDEIDPAEAMRAKAIVELRDERGRPVAVNLDHAASLQVIARAREIVE